MAIATGACPAAVQLLRVLVEAKGTADTVGHVFISRVAFTSVRITNSSPVAIAWHTDAEGPLAGGISVVARGTPLAELPPVSRRALAVLHPGSRDSGTGLC